MSSHKFKRIYHPRLGRFVYEHKGNGLIVDNIFKPLKSLASSAFKKVAKPMATHAGDKLGKKAAEKSGDFIMKKLHGSTKPSFTKTIKPPKSKKEEDYNTILNRLISGNGFKM